MVKKDFNRILITGCTGLLGVNYAKKILSTTDSKVYGVALEDQNNPAVKELINFSNFSYFSENIADCDFDSLLEEIHPDLIYHFALNRIRFFQSKRTFKNKTDYPKHSIEENKAEPFPEGPFNLRARARNFYSILDLISMNLIDFDYQNHHIFHFFSFSNLITFYHFLFNQMLHPNSYVKSLGAQSNNFPEIST